MTRHVTFAAALGVMPHAALAQNATGATAAATGMGQMLLGLAVVIALVFGAAWVARRLGVQGHDASPLLKRIAAMSVGPRERIVIVEAGNDWLVVGVTAQSIRTLHTLPKGVVPETPASQLAGGFAALLQKARVSHATR